MTQFQDLITDERVLRAIQDMGFTEATPIQEKVIPVALEGRDLIGQAQTGTGKTAAFGVPLLSKIRSERSELQCIAMAPTRELAIQVSEELNRLSKYKSITALPIYGGEDIGKQIRALKRRPQIIVATPGRLMDHMRRGTLSFENVHTVILDEADEMLSMGFIEDIETILKEVPTERQTFLFSATMPRRIKDISTRFMKDPVHIAVQNKSMTVDTIDQKYLYVKEREKFEALCSLLDMHSPELAIIFGKTKRRVDELSEALSIRGYEVEGIHGDMKQERREKVLRKFKRGGISILVATDVAARGLDISGVSHVFNFDMPQDPESYVHRIGRTGRAGKKGISYSFVTPREMEYLSVIESTTRKKMTRATMPTRQEAVRGRYQQAANKLVELSENIDENLLEQAQALLQQEGAEPIRLISAALKLAGGDINDRPVSLTEEAPAKSKRMPYKGGAGKPWDKNKSSYRDKNSYSGRKNDYHKPGNYKSRKTEGYKPASSKRPGLSEME